MTENEQKKLYDSNISRLPFHPARILTLNTYYIKWSREAEQFLPKNFIPPPLHNILRSSFGFLSFYLSQRQNYSFESTVPYTYYFYIKYKCLVLHNNPSI